MNNIKYCITIIFLSCILCSCSTNEYYLNSNTIYDRYIYAIKKIKNQEYKDSIKILKKLDKEYPFGIYTEKIKIALIHAYYKSNNIKLAKKLISKFIKYNPLYEKLDHLIYLRGLINISLDKNILKQIFFINQFEHNSIHAKEALYDFKKIIDNYPKSKYVKDSIKKVVYLNKKIARYELKIIQYYNNCHAYKAVINRSKNMIINFPYTKETYNSLIYMKNAYKELRLESKEKKVKKIIYEYNLHGIN